VIRCIGGVEKSDIENEARAIVSLLEGGTHQHIVEVFEHGWLSTFNCYFIDMELCIFTLRDYIDYHRGSMPDLRDTVARANSSALAMRDSATSLRMQNMWTIGHHIASGLEFMHTRKLVHRDLKPANGNDPKFDAVAHGCPVF